MRFFIQTNYYNDKAIDYIAYVKIPKKLLWVISYECKLYVCAGVFGNLLLANSLDVSPLKHVSAEMAKQNLIKAVTNYIYLKKEILKKKRKVISTSTDEIKLDIFDGMI